MQPAYHWKFVMPLTLLTNVSQYTGPGALAALQQAGHTVICHDPGFNEVNQRRDFEGENVSAKAIGAQIPGEIYNEVSAEYGIPDSIILNDVHPIHPHNIEDISLEEMRVTFEAVVINPVKITQLFLPSMKKRRCGAFVFVTSARETRPESGFAVPTTLRAATTAFAKSLAKEAAPFGIQANVVGPNYLYSEMYYPRARFIDDADGRETIARIVPFGRLGQPEEVGELITFLASGKSPFTTGQVIYFSGGWP